ncbi:bifunctional indole-3-glycerol-phosphate synthase TrpC/phosphoribosylanthranilate isomerase TrpF [Buchnera aphidicola (Hyadaphis tataricae)]|uniref:Multifunctional fusion protein n=1 Tax=Buchnera aphidicola (Hyadaphis tataricae) TaxID=1241859 RepID=A0A4D6Y6L7_9GAMM|nr:bifunctional indole-3-glycerol-phosphate synthase TrpC/phosphoribosylanthranilate isomerase TrpF [Buchnera aphidicola]QCI21580.1 bifunctional indole-3-glycerol-phosphate synthase TrpC/phosphoribosylanthranilate isomerase TrpF [Buchnera aphidicola (Hyadaphis tataricae)]
MQATILEKIIKNKMKWISFRKHQQPLIQFQRKINTQTRNFYHTLKKDKKPFFILECKKKSPSLGVLRKNFNLTNIAKVYKKYASAISVLTDEKYFDGNFDFINIVKQYAHQPILCKDFFVDVYQVYLARYYNADAILLMLSILEDKQYQELSKLAQELNMGILTEVNNVAELSRAIKLKANIIGINNRNLHDLSIDLNRTAHLSALIPKDIIIISESGIKKYSQIKKLSKFVNGFLVGSHLMTEKTLEIGVRSLIFGNNKVCGLTHSNDAKIIEKCGALYGGLIFVKTSLRKVDDKQAKNIILKNMLRYVGVFQNEDINIVVNIAEKLALHAVQLHGKEDKKYIETLRKTLPKQINIWKAFSIDKTFPSINWNHVNMYVFDSGLGGTNTVFNWSILKNHILENVILAGGINPNNCIEASKLNCSGLDLNSGVEICPGVKDHNKIKLIFQKLRYFV